MERVPLASWGCSIPESVPGLVGWGFDQPGLVSSSSHHTEKSYPQRHWFCFTTRDSSTTKPKVKMAYNIQQHTEKHSHFT